MNSQEVVDSSVSEDDQWRSNRKSGGRRVVMESGPLVMCVMSRVFVDRV